MEQLESLLMAWLLQIQGKRVEPDGDDRLGQVARWPKSLGKHCLKINITKQWQCPNLETTQQKLPKEQPQPHSAPIRAGLTSISSLRTPGPTSSPVQNRQQPLQIMQGRICNISLQQRLRRSQCWLFPPEVHERDMKFKAVAGFSAHSSMTDL